MVRPHEHASPLRSVRKAIVPTTGTGTGQSDGWRQVKSKEKGEKATRHRSTSCSQPCGLVYRFSLRWCSDWGGR
jgi:hypothetical protein